MAKLKKFKACDYDDVMLVPGRCVVGSRSEVDVTRSLGGRTFNLPVVPANMSTVINEKLAIQLAKSNYFYVLHRFNVDVIKFLKRCELANTFSSISLGVKEADYILLDEIKDSGYHPDYITVDVAHGYSDAVAAMVRKIKELLPTTYVIAGNVATPAGALFLEESACLSSPNTGFGTRGWQLSAIEEIANSGLSSEIIADGGIKTYGDIAKSLAFGADFVMIGGMFAGHNESPGSLIKDDTGKMFKEFFGSASEFQKGHKKNVEGKKLIVAAKGSIFETMQTIKENLQSSVSYAGGDNLEDLTNSEFVFISNIS